MEAIKELIEKYEILSKENYQEFKNKEGFEKGVHAGYMNCYLEVARDLDEILRRMKND